MYILRDILPNATSAETWVELWMIECIFLYSTENIYSFGIQKGKKETLLLFQIKCLTQCLSESRWPIKNTYYYIYVLHEICFHII